MERAMESKLRRVIRIGERIRTRKPALLGRQKGAAEGGEPETTSTVGESGYKESQSRAISLLNSTFGIRDEKAWNVWSFRSRGEKAPRTGRS